MKEVFFSIITVVYNDKEGFCNTKKNISEQIYKDFEWIIIDGASTDGTAEVVAELIQDPSLKWTSEQDNGIYDAMNKGLSIASGEFVVFMNAGDVFSSKETLQIVAEKISKQENAISILFGGANLVFLNGKSKYRRPRKSCNTIWHGLPATHQATYYKTDLIKNDPYDLKYEMCGDYYLTASVVIQEVSEAYIDEPLVDFRIGDFSFKNPILALTEAYSIQKNLLHSSLPFRVASFSRRLVAICVVFFLCQISRFR
ncbi:glycosyltransferase [Mariprofundus sp. EBB-1]|uniref:glycosyltransferase family 2 protein n=1 Tax=Mariprofundus sp. EBB-1 TaxID=2650971 RepID=UPI000EF1DF88|nr:glycosyltransferase family 2 protein [Mariprofundus sp. EBB-1]RLL50649.1 glycosyltransferase [Mariprofundus sp. EBB-1]